MEPTPKHGSGQKEPLNYSNALTSAMMQAGKASSLWFNHANNLACKAIALRAEKGPIHARDAAYITTLLPVPFLLNTRPLQSSATGQLAVSDTSASGMQAWYWFYATLGLGGALPCSVVASVTRVTIRPSTRVSAWVLNAACSDPETKAWHREDPIYLDDAHVHIDGARGRVVVTHPRAHGHLSAASLDLTFVKTGVQLSVSVITALGFVRPSTDNDKKALSQLLHVSDWGVVDGSVSAASVTIPQVKAPPKHFKYHSGDGKAWFSFKAIGVNRVSKFKEFLMSMFSRKPLVVKFVTLRLQAKDFVMEVFLPDASSIDALLVNRRVTCPKTVTVWQRRGEQAVRRGLTARLTILEEYRDAKYSALPCVLELDVAGFGSMRLTSRTRVPLEMQDVNSVRLISLMDVTAANSHQKLGEGVLEWVPGNLPRRSEVIRVSDVDNAVIAASFAGNPRARVAFGLGLAGLVLIYVSVAVLLLSYAYKNLLTQRR